MIEELKHKNKVLRDTLVLFAIADSPSPDRKWCNLCKKWVDGYNKKETRLHDPNCLLYEEK